MLFDRQKDPEEVNNLIDVPEYEEIAKELYGYFEEFESNIARAEAAKS